MKSQYLIIVFIFAYNFFEITLSQETVLNSDSEFDSDQDFNGPEDIETFQKSCRPNGGRCQFNSKCCSRKCDKTLEQCVCKSKNEICKISLADQCCSGNCTLKPGKSNPTCGCSKLGGSCITKKDCCSRSNRDCISNICTKVCSPENGPCSNDGDCCSTDQFQCDLNNICVPRCSNEGSACQIDSDCCGLASQYCDNTNKTCAPCRQRNTSCETTNQCCVGMICNTSKLCV